MSELRKIIKAIDHCLCDGAGVVGPIDKELLREAREAATKVHSLLADIDSDEYLKWVNQIGELCGLSNSRSHLADHFMGIEYKVNLFRRMLLEAQIKDFKEPKKKKEQ